MATKKGVKKKEHENLDDATIERVIALLNDPKPITKKVACEILNISYNTTRLNDIINEYIDKKDRRQKLFDKTRGTPITEAELSNMVTWKLQGATYSDISEWTYRSASTVKNVLESLGIPSQPKGDEYFKSAILPDECVLKEEPKVGDFLWSAKYHAICEVMKEKINTDGSKSYYVYIYEKSESRHIGGFYAAQPIYELGSLTHLQKYIDVKKLIS